MGLYRGGEEVRSAFRVILCFALMGLCSLFGWSQSGQAATSTSNPPSNPSPTKPQKTDHKGKAKAAPGKEMGKGGEDIGKGAAKGTGDLAKGTAGAVGSLAHGDVGGAGASLGKGAGKMGKDVAVGGGKGVGKLGKGLGGEIKKLHHRPQRQDEGKPK